LCLLDKLFSLDALALFYRYLFCLRYSTPVHVAGCDAAGDVPHYCTPRRARGAVCRLSTAYNSWRNIVTAPIISRPGSVRATFAARQHLRFLPTDGRPQHRGAGDLRAYTIARRLKRCAGALQAYPAGRLGICLLTFASPSWFSNRLALWTPAYRTNTMPRFRMVPGGTAPLPIRLHGPTLFCTYRNNCDMTPSCWRLLALALPYRPFLFCCGPSWTDLWTWTLRCRALNALAAHRHRAPRQAYITAARALPRAPRYSQRPD